MVIFLGCPEKHFSNTEFQIFLIFWILRTLKHNDQRLEVIPYVSTFCRWMLYIKQGNTNMRSPGGPGLKARACERLWREQTTDLYADRELEPSDLEAPVLRTDPALLFSTQFVMVSIHFFPIYIYIYVRFKRSSFQDRAIFGWLLVTNSHLLRGYTLYIWYLMGRTAFWHFQATQIWFLKYVLMKVL